MSDENKYPLVMDNSLLSYVPFFDWLNELTEDKFVELFPGIFICFNAPWEDEIVRSGTKSEVAYHILKAAELHSAETCNGAVCELLSVHEEVERFLESLNLNYEFYTPVDLTSSIFTGVTLLLMHERTQRISRLISFDEGVYSSLWMNDYQVDIRNETLIRRTNLSNLETEIISREIWLGYTQKWIWALVFVLIKYKPNDRIYRFLLYCSNATYHKNAFHKLMNFFSAIEAIFGFSKDINKNIVDFAPLLLEKDDYDTTSQIRQFLKDASKLRNVHAHGRKVRESHYELLQNTTNAIEVICLRLLRGIIDIGFVPEQSDLIDAKRMGLHMTDWVVKTNKEVELPLDSISDEVFSFEFAYERYRNIWPIQDK